MSTSSDKVVSTSSEGGTRMSADLVAMEEFSEFVFSNRPRVEDALASASTRSSAAAWPANVKLHSPLGGEVEWDEIYFGDRRKGPRGSGAASKVLVFGLLKRSGKVYARIVEDVSRKTLRQIIRTKVVPESVIYTDSFYSYDGLVLDGFQTLPSLGTY
jgi:transposase-like protein